MLDATARSMHAISVAHMKSWRQMQQSGELSDSHKYVLLVAYAAFHLFQYGFLVELATDNMWSDSPY
jgi:hypothetical protein